jgi:DNA-binding response OmpR family regulator
MDNAGAPKAHTILIVEDEAPLLSALADNFHAEGFEVLQAHNGQEGLEIALTQHPSFILLDVVMPVMDGLTMLGKLREDHWGRGVPVILLTNLNDSNTITQSMDLQVVNYWVKADWRLQDLLKAVKEKLEVLDRLEVQAQAHPEAGQ